MIQTEVLVVGAGPAGIAAAASAAEKGCKAIILDDNAAPGGQIWRGGIGASGTKAGFGEDAARYRALTRLERSGATILSGYRVFNAQASGTLQALRQHAGGSTAYRFQFKRLIIATGARERFLPFPGWTLPGVFGAGGLQALVRGGFSIKGKRVLVAGTGPLLLAVAAHLQGHGAEVVGVVEQASLSRLVTFGASLWSHPAKLWQGLQYRASMLHTPYKIGCWPVAANADENGALLRSITLSDGRRTWEQPCDLLACGFHLVPNTELASLLGCTIRGGVVEVDGQQKTSAPTVFCAGEPAGIAGLDAASVQGEIAGLACAGASTEHLQKRAAAERIFAQGLARAFALRPELLKLATPETIICRCEDVRLAGLVDRNGWTDAKLQTRCGMGACQGRVCGPAIEALFGWQATSVRQPLFPVPLHALCSTEEELQLT